MTSRSHKLSITFPPIALCVLLATATVAHAQCHYKVTAIMPGINCPGNGVLYFGSHDINAAGLVAGTREKCPYQSDNTNALVWDTVSGVVQTLIVPPGIVSAEAVAINNAGHVAGLSWTTPEGNSHACLWTGSGYFDLPPQVWGNESWANDINNAGTVVGGRGFTTGLRQPFVWSNGRFIDIPPDTWTVGEARDVNDGGVVVGTLGPTTNGRGFIWQGGLLELLQPSPGAVASSANAVNEAGRVVGLSVLPGVPQNAFPVRPCIWIDGLVASLPIPAPYTMGAARHISNKGVVVGEAWKPVPPQGVLEAITVLWIDGVPYNLDDLVVDFEPATFGAGRANDAGQMVGVAQTYTGIYAIVLSPVDPPAADVTGDCAVDARDLAVLLQAWGGADPISDLNSDGTVDGRDLGLLLGSWTTR